MKHAKSGSETWLRPFRGWLMVLLLVLGLGATWGITGSVQADAATAPSWTNIWNVTPGHVTSLADANGTVYAGTYTSSSGVYSYAGSTWTQVLEQGSPSPPDVTFLLAANGVLYGAGDGGGMLNVFSLNGSSWTLFGGSIPPYVDSLVDVNGAVYAGTNGYSHNEVWWLDGGTWTDMSNSPINVRSLLDVGNTLYAGTDTSGFSVYSYDGSTWTQMSGSPTNVYSLLDVNGTLYAGTLNGVYTYNGTSWTPMSGSPSYVHSLVDANGTLYAGDTLNGVYSYDGSTWTQMSGSPTYVSSLLVANGALYAGGSNGVSESLLPPTTPTNVQVSTATVPTATTVTLTWNTAQGAATYNVYEGGGSTPIAAGVSDTTATISGLTPGTPYSFTVSAVNSGGESVPSSSVRVNTTSIRSVTFSSGTTYALTGTPTSVTGFVYDVNHIPVPNASVHLSSAVGDWSLTGTSSESVTTDVYGHFSAIWTAPSVTTNTADTLKASVPNTFVPTATESIDLVAQMGITTQTLPDATVGTAYAQTLSAVGAFSNLTWSVTSGALPGGMTLDSTTGVIRGTPIATGPSTFTVQVSDVAGNVATQSLSLTVQPPPVAPPVAPSGLAHTDVTPTGWTESWGAVSGASAYNVYVNGAKVDSSPVASTSYTVTGESAGTSYNITVTTVNGAGESAPSSVDTVTTSGTGGTGGTGGNGGTGNTGGTSPLVLPTVVASDTVTNAGSTFTNSAGNTGVTVEVPKGAFAQTETLTVTTGTPANLDSAITGLATSNTAVVLGVNFSGATPQLPVTVTITNPDISAGSPVYKLGPDGTLIPLNAQVSDGKIVVSFTSDPDFVVLKLKPYERVIALAGQVSTVSAIVHSDAGVNTTYMPIWYVMHLLKTLGITSRWNGKVWSLTSTSPVDLTTIQAGQGTQEIALNGILVQDVTGVATTDPYTGRPTMYMPIWYMMKILSRLGLYSQWNGTTWSLRSDTTTTN